MENGVWNTLNKLKTMMTAPKAQSTSAMQLSQFNECWLRVQAAISTPEKRKLDIQQTKIPVHLKNMIDSLVVEQSRLDDVTETTGVCMEYLLKNDCLTKLVNACAEGDSPRGIVIETIRTIASMINLLYDRFLVHNAVHRPIVKLLRTCCASGTEMEGNEGYHEDLVDLMYVLCSRIHGYPELLNIFFHDKQWQTVSTRFVDAQRLQKNRETNALLKSISQHSDSTFTNLDNDSPPKPAAEPIMSGGKGGPIFDDKVDMDFPSNFSDYSSDGTESTKTKCPPKKEYEFLLFTYLSKFVHHEGKVGDFARTGLLFLMELATGSLGEYIQDSEFATYLIAGIGALYSQLPRKLIVKGGSSNNNGKVAPAPMVPSRRANIELSTSPAFRSRLDAFLKALEFCQDILVRCPNTAIARTLLTSFKVVFLESILYPSIMECADTDGSAVAVISYIDQILQTLQHEAFVDLVVGFLMESEDDLEMHGKLSENMEIFTEVQNLQTTSPYFTAIGRFTLKDLVLSRLKSQSQPTVIATLKLLNTLITRHCKYALKLLSIQPENRAFDIRGLNNANSSVPGSYQDVPMFNHHAHELDLFYSLIAAVNPYNNIEGFCSGYDAYLRDAEGALWTHERFGEPNNGDALQNDGKIDLEAERKKQRRRSMKYGDRMDLSDGHQSLETPVQGHGRISSTSRAPSSCSCSATPRHRLLPSEPLLQILLGILSHFFAHTAELNIALTGVITSLAVCPSRSLEGWLLFKASDIEKPDIDCESGDESEGGNGAYQKALSEEGSFGLISAFNSIALEALTGDAFYDSDDEDSMPIFIKNEADALSHCPPHFKSFPPFFTMLRTLTQQVDYYRSEIDGFDDYLAEKRRVLLCSDEDSTINSTSVLSQTTPLNNHQLLLPNHPSNMGSMYGSNDSFFSISGDPAVNPRLPVSAVVRRPSLSNLLASAVGSTNPSVVADGNKAGTNSIASSSVLQQANTKTPASPGSSTMFPTSRARKSSSPLSLMATPSNLPFMVPPGMNSKQRRSISASPLAGGSISGTAEAPAMPRRPSTNAGTDTVTEAESRGFSSTSSTSQIRPSSLSKSLLTMSVTSSTGSPSKPTSTSGMFAFGASSLQGRSNISNGGNNATHNPTSTVSMLQTQTRSESPGTKPLSNIMETMMIRPLFTDGFLDDSDCELENHLHIRAKLRGDQEESEEDNEDEDVSDNESNSSSNDNSDTSNTNRAHKASTVNEAEFKAQEPLNHQIAGAEVGIGGGGGGGGEAGGGRSIHMEIKRDIADSSLPPTIISNTRKTRRARKSSTPVQKNTVQKEKMVTLSQLLTNVVILEEVVKEVVAIAQVRRAIGLDKVRFL
ncbi:hypothetical protein BX616_000670 [Lobosporangium transversale]|uniref:Retinoic acid induced 16-like protein-domain-containing protein n=1 Tax=Lobosporangium transversale TaxID=64571 RepID=A0A1Y2GZ66_9FUNG|nr:Retinoic acid induced 16-like protein-domain-containing protein [Lobosporangium transversale]KAF9906606.1 hypothetical protein BX616_000670 [Lobosporangium transversale]ORZ27600.1 Retinoic acid induced 16-like protein-domain-containing protein [Lobosporangium transversale]|eukprot:XP_021885303.1 Retinoic acid induced 16-like protein-domain-containing protein [Lobosporangium transversale]